MKTEYKVVVVNKKTGEERKTTIVGYTPNSGASEQQRRTPIPSSFPIGGDITIDSVFRASEGMQRTYTAADVSQPYHPKVDVPGIKCVLGKVIGTADEEWLRGIISPPACANKRFAYSTDKGYAQRARG
jgi:hypothetical protein